MTITLDDLALMVANGFKRMDERFTGLEERMDRLEARMDRLEARMDSIESRMDRVEARLDSVEAEMQSLRRDFERLDAKVSDHGNYTKEIDGLRGRIMVLEGKLASMGK